MTKQMTNGLSRFSRIALAVGLVVAVGGATIGTASADGHHDRGWHNGPARGERGRWDHRHYYVPPPVVVAAQPAYGYVPPPVVVAPPPMAPGLNIVLPINIR